LEDVVHRLSVGEQPEGERAQRTIVLRNQVGEAVGIAVSGLTRS